MSPEQTIAKLKAMRLSAMAEAYRSQLDDPLAFRDMGFDERLGALVDHEADVRATNKVARLVKRSQMYFRDAFPEDIRYGGARGLSRDGLARVLDCSFLDRALNVILEGPSACGKTWVACAIGTAACRRGYKVRYYKARSLVDELRVARHAEDGSYQKELGKLKKIDLLIVDDFLLHEVTATEMGELLELVDMRLFIGSTIFCSQYRHEGWMEIIGHSPVSEAFMSRVSSSSYVFCMDSSEDMRIEKERLF